ncbi:hypothetical protein OQJ18_05130 [Fluoribacter dumoffii]|uniref:Uncharacterized protein n=1 Tax=Fluoribacter dumoffii TaxID=463 RepID=A0A377G9A1_9GAMM|nr:hypothetical protein [Fluoribacter dumoffii]KTC90185.1 hypothetical protein Ldum_1253 [Fluoribacter dumoffii NY 23]MCW8385480.1 hypothetical protein [Fluoribacter dumoffii]MCW8418531.1 hypothetical protein [Fluoribacter dumoffii]MCW8453627.1 hypothetical protein [Fluoribacter dumoffii]MCW8459155.1 hypothetical protein [Fluoribacter dumoffii]
MKVKQPLTYILGLILFTLSFVGNADQCSYELPPNEQITLQGKETGSRTLSCKVEHNVEGSDFMMNFVSETNTSIVNNLIMPEDTIMTLSFASMNNNALKLELKTKAKLGITNESTDVIRMICLEL